MKHFIFLCLLLSASAMASLTADEAREATSRAMKRCINKTIRSIDDQINSVIELAGTSVTITSECYLDQKAVEQVKSHYEINGYKVSVRDSNLIAISWIK